MVSFNYITLLLLSGNEEPGKRYENKENQNVTISIE
jgi:hypothetical protein